MERLGSERSGKAGLGGARYGKTRAVNSGKGSVSNGGFIEADSFTWIGVVRPGLV